MDKNNMGNCNYCNTSSCKELKNDKCCKNKKVYCSGQMDCPSCPTFVIPVNCEDAQIFNILCCSIGQTVGLKLEGSDCILRLKIRQVNQCAVMGKTSSGKGPIYIKLSAIQYVDLGKEVYVNPLCNVGNCTGIQGPAGPKGDKGDKGDVGPQGPVGPKGDKGPAGTKGDKGDIGPQGPVGPTGPKGDKGDIGPQGPAGTSGPSSKGIKGDVGPTGPKGDKGDIGPQGPVGPTGPKGDKGDMGPQGPAGTIIPTPIPEKEYKKKKYNSNK